MMGFSGLCSGLCLWLGRDVGLWVAVVVVLSLLVVVWLAVDVGLLG